MVWQLVLTVNLPGYKNHPEDILQGIFREVLIEREDPISKWPSFSRVNPDIKRSEEMQCPLSTLASSCVSCSLSPSSAAMRLQLLWQSSMNSLPSSNPQEPSRCHLQVLDWQKEADTTVYSQQLIPEWVLFFFWRGGEEAFLCISAVDRRLK